MKKIKNLFIFTGSLICVCAPTALMIIGIWMIYNVGLFIGSVIGLAGFIGTLYIYYVNMIMTTRISQQWLFLFFFFLEIFSIYF